MLLFGRKAEGVSEVGDDGGVVAVVHAGGGSRIRGHLSGRVVDCGLGHRDRCVVRRNESGGDEVRRSRRRRVEEDCGGFSALRSLVSSGSLLTCGAVGSRLAGGRWGVEAATGLNHTD